MTESAWSARPVMGLAGTAEHRYMPTSAAFKPPSGELARCGRWVERAVWPRSIVGSMLDVTRLRVLVAIARNGSVTAAARALNYAQPSISHHIARLEAETGARLLERAGRGVRLTEAGRMLAERAEEIIGRLDAAEAELAAHVGLREGRVRLAAFPSALGTLVPAAAAWLESETPGLDLRLTEAEPPEALRMLRAGYVDAALVFRHYQEGTGEAPPSAEEGTRGRLILDEPVYLVTRAEADPAAAA